MRLIKGAKRHIWVILIGIGLALSPIHNLWLTNAATNSQGEVVFFLPAFGYLMLIMGAGLFLLYNWEKVKANGLGDKRIWIPLLVIVGAIGLSGIAIDGSVQDKIAPLGMGAVLFALYLAARILGKGLFYPLAIGAAIGSLGIIAHQIVSPSAATGGFVFEQNCDIATGYILMGAALFVHRWRWWLASLAVVALLASGTPEAVFALGVVGLFGLFRKDWSKKTVPMAAILGVLLVAGLATGLLQSAYSYVRASITQTPTAHYVSPDGEKRLVSPLDVRWLVIRDAMTDIQPLGIGYGLTNFRPTTVHNVPLILIQQMGWPGMLAAIAWLWVTIWCLRKTRWRYAWVAVIALSFFDHYIWSQLAPVWWLLIGVSVTGSTLEGESDLVFRSAT